VRPILPLLLLIGWSVAEAASPKETAGAPNSTAKSASKSTVRPGTRSGRSVSPAAAGLSTERLVEQTRAAIVRIDGRGRDGTQEGVGTGFVIDADGLVATSLHVIGEGRALQVRLADGSTPEVLGVHAWDRPHDLAILKVRAMNLVAVPLGDSDSLPQGAPVVAVGHPLGLTHSVVEGVLSARRDLDGHPMLQLAMPIEPGNSGGPLLDRSGRVHGIVNAKSLLTQNLGFATPANHLGGCCSNDPTPCPWSGGFVWGPSMPPGGSRSSGRAGDKKDRGFSWMGWAPALAVAPTCCGGSRPRKPLNWKSRCVWMTRRARRD